MCFERGLEILSDTTNTDTAPPKPSTATYKSSLFNHCVYSINLKIPRDGEKKRYFKTINFIFFYIFAPCILDMKISLLKTN